MLKKIIIFVNGMAYASLILLSFFTAGMLKGHIVSAPQEVASLVQSEDYVSILSNKVKR